MMALNKLGYVLFAVGLVFCLGQPATVVAVAPSSAIELIDAVRTDDRVRVERQDAVVVFHHFLDEGHLQGETGIFLDRFDLAELQHQRLFALVDDKEPRGKNKVCTPELGGMTGPPFNPAVSRLHPALSFRCSVTSLARCPNL